jgi:hypothetical protein
MKLRKAATDRSHVADSFGMNTCEDDEERNRRVATSEEGIPS